MGIQINGNTNNINAGIGSLSIEDLNELDIVGVATASNFKTGVSNLHNVGLTLSGGQIDVGSNIKLGNAGVITATSFVGSGANLTGLPAGTTINSNTNNYLITGTGSSNTLQGEANLTFDGSNLQFNTTANGNAIKLVATGNHYNKILLDSNASSAGAFLNVIDFKWDGDKVADIVAISGSDTSNKDDGHLVFRTSPSQGAIAERLRIASNGQVSISSDGTTDGLLTIKGDTDQVGTPSIRLLDGSDTREVSITNTSGDFVASVHGNDNAIHGHIKLFESGQIDFNNGGASGSNVNRLRITSTGILVTGNGTAPNSTDTGSIFMPGGGDLGWLTSSGSITFNAYYSGGWKYVTSGTSHILWASSEGFNFSTASSGSANGAISYSRAMKIFTNNRVSIGDGNSGTPLGALHINTKSTMGTDTALFIGDNAGKRYLAINQTSNSEQFSEMKLQYNDNGTRSVLKLSNPYAPAGYGTAILWQGYNDGQQGMIACQSENANSSVATMYLNSSSGTFLKGNSSRHVTMPQQPSFSASRNAGAVYNGSTIVFNVVDFNNGSHYNNGNGIFTAPTAGKYQFSVAGMAAGGNSDFQVRIQKNGSNYFNNNGSGRGQSTFEPYGFTVLMNLAANDTVNCTIYSSNSSSYFYATGTIWNKFSGSLIA